MWRTNTYSASSPSPVLLPTSFAQRWARKGKGCARRRGPCQQNQNGKNQSGTKRKIKQLNTHQSVRRNTLYYFVLFSCTPTVHPKPNLRLCCLARPTPPFTSLLRRTTSIQYSYSHIVAGHVHQQPVFVYLFPPYGVLYSRIETKDIFVVLIHCGPWKRGLPLHNKRCTPRRTLETGLGGGSQN